MLAYSCWQQVTKTDKFQIGLLHCFRLYRKVAENLKVLFVDHEGLKDVSLCVNVRDFIHLGLDTASIAVADSLLDQQDHSGRRDGLYLDGDLLALGLL